MANVPPLGLKRTELAKIVGNNSEVIRQFENLFKVAEEAASGAGSGEIAAALAAATANAALALVEQVRQMAEALAYGPQPGPAYVPDVYVPPQAAIDLSALAGFETIVSAPLSGFSITVPDNGRNYWLILEPATGLASGTIVLPDAAGAVDGQQVMVSTWDQILSLTVSAPGASATYGIPAVMGADDCFRAKYARDTNSWYSVA